MSKKAVKEGDPDVWHIDGKVVRTSKKSIAAMDMAIKKYANALKRLASK